MNRLFDHSMEGFKNWEFMTTHCWGEKAAGDWVLEIYDSPSQLRSQKVPGNEVVNKFRKLAYRIIFLQNLFFSGKLKEWSLVLYGTSVNPYSSPHVEKPRFAVPSPEDDVTEEYNGR